MVFRQKMALLEALQYGVETEETKYGLGISEPVAGTKIFSFGDLATNFAGLKFWSQLTEESNMLGEYLNLTGHPQSAPYFVCNQTTKNWEQHRQFDWNEYVTPAWDESINPVEFAKREMREKFMRRLNELAAQGVIPSAQLPLFPELCAQMKNYDTIEHLQYMLHPACLKLAL